MVMSPTLQRLSQSTLVDAFLLRRAEETVASYPEARVEKMREYFKAAEQRARAADELYESQAAASLVLSREAALLYMAALLSVHAEEPPSEPLRAGEVVAAFEKIEPRDPCPRPPNELTDFYQLLTASDPMVFDRIAPEDAVQRSRSVREIVGWLGRLNDPRSVKQIRLQRVVRLGLLGLIVVGSLVWGLSVLLTPTNIALHKPVAVSSVMPGAGGSAAALVDGITSGAYAAQTSKEENPWVQIDLLDVYRISGVKIYNRGDGWFDEGLPMTLELSENGTDFVEVDKRTKSFGQWLPWSASPGNKKARYVRVRGNRGAYVTLNEIEVFGKK
jgi:hypothetical protein